MKKIMVLLGFSLMSFMGFAGDNVKIKCHVEVHTDVTFKTEAKNRYSSRQGRKKTTLDKVDRSYVIEKFFETTVGKNKSIISLDGDKDIKVSLVLEEGKLVMELRAGSFWSRETGDEFVTDIGQFGFSFSRTFSFEEKVGISSRYYKKIELSEKEVKFWCEFL